MNSVATEILIVGGGPAGMSAALTACTKANVTLIDDNPGLGGQIWRAELGKTKSPDAKRLIEALDQTQIKVVKKASVFASEGDSLLAETPTGTVRFEYQKLILATGARERFLPFPGWTLPNVFGAAGLQALVKGGLCVKNKRIIVAGTGPLLLVVAEYLRSKGGDVLAICEQTSNRNLDKFAFGLWKTPSKIFQGIKLRAKLRGIPYYKNSWILAAHGTKRLQSVTVRQFGKTADIDCDLLACGFHLGPNIELAQLLGCKLDNGFVAVDEYRQTSLKNVYCAGEPTGIGGVEASLVEGKIAGYAAIKEFEAAKKFFAKQAKTSEFARRLDRAFALSDDLKTLADASTIVCRCEDVQYKKLTEYNDFRTAKLQTRCGMGSCQGRICGPATEFLFGWKERSVRPPIFPVKMENL